MAQRYSGEDVQRSTGRAVDFGLGVMGSAPFALVVPLVTIVGMYALVHHFRVDMARAQDTQS